MDTCVWKQSIPDYGDSTWETSCGFTLYTPSDDWDDWKYCPYCGQELVRECAKNTEQLLQPENGPVKCANNGCAGWDNGFCAMPGLCREGAVSG